MKNVVIISYVQPYNRQGYDLNNTLQKAGVRSCLLQTGGESCAASRVIGVRLTKPHGRFHKFHVLLNVLRLVFRSVFLRKDIIVCIGGPSLIIGGLYKKIFRCEVVYYALEYSNVHSCVDNWVLTKCIDKYIDVEENRCHRALREIGREDIPNLVIHNMPMLHGEVHGGALRQYLQEKYNVGPSAKIAIYAGSYQDYACLGQIVAAAKLLPDGYVVVLMAFGLPESLTRGSNNCYIVPPVRGDAFYDWLADADCSLLPYESESDFNVKNCSPQKIFDCYLAGVPYLASRRPIVLRTLEVYSEAGRTCDFNNPIEIAKGLVAVCDLHAHVKGEMIRLHGERFNYEGRGKDIVRFILSEHNA